MMWGNVVNLPPMNVREWAVMRRRLEGALREAGHDEELVQLVCQEIRGPALSALGQSVLVPEGTDQAVRQVNAWFSAVVGALLTQLAGQVLRNLELERELAGGRG